MTDLFSGTGSYVLAVIIFTSVIHIVDTLAYSVRLNSVRSGQFALSFSLFNIIVLVSRTANMLMAPFIGKIMGVSISTRIDPIWDIRKIILAATLGTLAGIILIPTFLKLFALAVEKLGTAGSIPSLVVQALSVSNLKRVGSSISRPSKRMLSDLRYRDIPKRMLILNMLITSIYTIGVLAANYSSFFVSNADNRLAAVNSSGLINGIASILLTLAVDPKAAVITDEAYRGKRQYGDVKVLVIMLIASKLLGTILGQVLILPCARLLAAIYN